MYNNHSIDEFGDIAISNSTAITTPRGVEIIWQDADVPLVERLYMADASTSVSAINFTDAIITCETQLLDIKTYLYDTIISRDTPHTSYIIQLLQQIATSDIHNTLTAIPLHDVILTDDNTTLHSFLHIGEFLHIHEQQLFDARVNLRDIIATSDTIGARYIYFLYELATCANIKQLINTEFICNDTIYSADTESHGVSISASDHTHTSDTGETVPIVTYIEHIVTANIITHLVDYMAVMFGNYSCATSRIRGTVIESLHKVSSATTLRRRL